MTTFHEKFKELMDKTNQVVFDPASGMSGIAINLGPGDRLEQKIQCQYGPNNDITRLTLTQIRESKGLQLHAFTSGNNPNARIIQQVNFHGGQFDITVE